MYLLADGGIFEIWMNELLKYWIASGWIDES